MTKSFESQYVISLVLMFLLVIAYGHSTSIYIVSMSLLIIFTYYKVIKYIKFFPRIFVYIYIYFFTIPFFIGICKGQFQDVLMANVSIFLPMVILIYPVREKESFNKIFLLGILVIVVNCIHQYVSVLKYMNENTYSFLLFMSSTAIFILTRMKKNIMSLILLFYCGYAFSRSGSRNVFVIYIFMVILIFIPYKILVRKLVYRIIYISSLIFQCITNVFMVYAERNIFLSSLFNDVINSYTHKAWGIENRVNVYTSVSGLIWDQDLFSIFFGNGKAFLHAHNGFYQTTFIYGIVGFILITLLYIVIFEMGLNLLKKRNNHFIAGCFISLCGLFFLQGADVFMFGCKTCSVLPFLLSGTIVRKYIFENNFNKGENVKHENRSNYTT